MDSSGEPSVVGGRVFSRYLTLDGIAPREAIVIFSNAGDMIRRPSKKGKSPAPIEAETRRDFREIEIGLTALLGKGTPFSSRVGGALESGQKWVFDECEIWLLRIPDHHVRMKMAFPNSGNHEIADISLRKTVAGRIESRSNGDVVIGDFPMVEQGERGFCVPATWARLLTYMGCPTDMFAIGSSSGATGAGTDPLRAARAASLAASKCGRRINYPKMKPTVSEVKTYIDKGIPIAWGMVSSRSFERQGKVRGAQISGPVGTGTLALVAPERGANHMCAIIGYNAYTKEIALTDSWGNDYRERWYPEKAIKEASQGLFYIVDF